MLPRVPVFYSFHYDYDVFRVQQVRNMGIVDGTEPVTANDWEQIKRSGNAAIERWIDENMKYKRCVIVLIGEETANRPWVRREIVKAWNAGKGLVGVRIHNLKCPRNGTSAKGPNPFDLIKFDNGRPMSDYIKCHDPSFLNAYDHIKSDMRVWIEEAITDSRSRQ